MGKYAVVAPIARGGMAAIYLAEPADRPGERVALKVIAPEHADDTELARMFLDEARILDAVEHPNVVRMLDQGQDQGRAYLVMEYLPAVSLARLCSGAREPLGEAFLSMLLGAMADAAEAVAAAHAATDSEGRSLGVVHRDVSPQNILVCKSGRVALIDFGIALGKGRSTRTRTGQIKGKFQYMAPEQVSGEGSVGPAADVWSLAVVTHEAITGEHPFEAASEATTLWNVMYKDAPDLSAFAPGLSAELLSVLGRCLDRSAPARPAASELATALRRESARCAAADQPSLAEAVTQLMSADSLPPRSAPPPPAPTPADGAAPRSKRPLWIAAVVGIVAALGLWSGRGWLDPAEAEAPLVRQAPPVAARQAPPVAVQQAPPEAVQPTPPAAPSQEDNRTDVQTGIAEPAAVHEPAALAPSPQNAASDTGAARETRTPPRATKAPKRKRRKRHKPRAKPASKPTKALLGNPY